MATDDGHVCLSGDLDQFCLATCLCEILVPEPNLPNAKVSPPPKKGAFSMFRRNKKVKDPSNNEKFTNLYSLGKCNLNLLKSFDKDIKMVDTNSEKSVALRIKLNIYLDGELNYVVKERLWHEVVLTSGASRRQFVLHFEASEDFDDFYKQLTSVFQKLEYCNSKNKQVNETYFLVAFKYKTGNQDKKSNISISTPNLYHTDKDKEADDKYISDKSRETTQNGQDNWEPQEAPVTLPVPFSPASFKSPLSGDKDQQVFTFDVPENKQTNTETEKYQRNLSATSTASLQSPPSLNTLLNDIKSSKSIENGIEVNPSIVSSQSDYMTMIMDKPDPGAEHWKNIGHFLETAICSGEKQHAQEYASVLSEHKIKVKVEVDTSAMRTEPKDTEISLKVYIEDRDSSGGCISLKVKPTDTVRDLKNRMFMKHKFPVEVQRWIIGQRIPKDNETLRHCNVKTSGTVVYLYLVSAKSVGLNREEVESRHAQQILPQSNANTMLPPNPLPQLSVESGDYVQMTMGQPYSPQTPQSNISSSSQQTSNRSRSMHSPGSANTLQQGLGHPMQRQQQVPLQQGHSVPNIPVQGQGQNQQGQRLPQVHSDPSVGAHQQRVQGRQPASAAASLREESEIGWQCPACTYINLPTRPGCEICSGDRPKNYVIPKDYQLREEEKARIQQELEMENQVKQLEAKRREEQEKKSAENFQRLLAAEGQHLVTNTQEFDCPICFDIIEPGEGVILRECLHAFCKTCLQSAIQYNEEAALRCPFQDDSYMCNAVLQDREVKALVPPEVFEKYLQRSLSTAESQAANSFHCKTPDCRGWCIYEDLENFFKCPVCKHENCLTCKAIHEGMNCKQYQEDIKIRASNDKAAKRTQEMLQNMVKEGEAMHCPKCQVILQKKDGCDWIKCSICKTEICWVTKGFRWGPMGPGDISGGCRCRVNGQQCHVNCNNCH